MAKRIDYNNERKLNGITIHEYTCRDCMKRFEGIGSKTSAKKKAYNHDCVDTSNDPWKERKDLQ